MGKIRKYKNVIERFLAGAFGQRFFNFAFSIGAAVVILGALFKILHLKGGNEMLTIGMGTEVLMFVLTAFDRPQKEYDWEQVFPVLGTRDPDDRPDFNGGGGIVVNGAVQETVEAIDASQAKAAVGLPQGIELTPEQTTSLGESIARMSAATEQLSKMADLSEATAHYLEQMSGISEQMQRLNETTTALNKVSETLLTSYRSITENSEGIKDSSTGYVEQMANLNHNISGLNTIYEIQLKSISSQLDSIDRVNRGLKDIRDMYEKSAAESAHYCDETEKMARYMKQLNGVYEKMIKAMTVNMYRPMGGAMPGVDLEDNNDENVG
ncbi:gliding motility-associated protein GldL [Chlamydia trachomatis]|jgi:hypothetical protein|nr:gliding motility-associated protein GldL [Chlamydia trachomatis]